MGKTADRVYQELQETLGQLEEQRLLLKKKGTKEGFIALAVLIVTGLIISLTSGDTNFIWTILLTVFGLLILVGAINAQSGKLTKSYKENVIGHIVTFLCEDAKYLPEGGISAAVFTNCSLFPYAPDRYSCEDLISGKIDKTIFGCSEVHAERKRTTKDSKGNTKTSWHDIFRGFLFVADFNKDFKGRTIVSRNSTFISPIKGERVHLEDPDFEKRFNVYSTDQVEARYILSTSLMKRITDLDKTYNGKITLSFFNSSLVIAIPDIRNHFEASIWQSFLDKKFFDLEFNTIKQMIDIIEDLNLNLRIWTKR